MERLKLLIAEGTEDFRMALADALEGAYILRECDEGVQALELMSSFRPDVVVLDLMLPGLDGITLLQRAAESELHPIVLATTRFHNEYVLEAAQSLGVAYVLVKPCEIRATVSRLEDICQRIHPPVSRLDAKEFVSNVLLSLGIPTKLKGYGYLREAILRMAQDPTQSITKVLYPAVAAVYRKENMQIDAKHVERSIRSAIERAWERRDATVWQQYFSADGDGTLRRPSNGAFISWISDSLCREMEK